VWSPSGRAIAFDDLEQVGDDSVAMAVHVVQLGDGEVAASERLGRGEVAFFLDEQQLVVHTAFDGQRELVVVDIATGERRALTRGAEREYRATLSPDGRLIAWIEAGEPGDRLKIMNRDGSGARVLADVDHWFAGPSFSPDGRCLVFESGAERRETEVWVVPAAGGEVRALTRDGGSFPVWRPVR
jgi:TolB protein